jgi:hypothetical protein
MASKNKKREKEKTMKQYKVFTIVVFMICFSLIAFVSQGEEWKDEVALEQDDDISWSTKTDAHVETSLYRAVQVSELEETSMKPMPEIQGPLARANVPSESTYHEAISFEEIPEPVDGRVEAIVDMTPLDENTASIIVDYADQYDLRLSLVLGLIDLESNFGQYLVGTSQDRGYMQIIPGTEKWLATSYGEELGLTYDTSRIFDADYNIPLGIKYLSILKNQYGSETKMLTSYNRGDYGMEKWYEANGTYETTYSRVVLKRAEKYEHID